MTQTESARTSGTRIGHRLTRLDYYLGIVLLGIILLLGDRGIRHAQAGPATPSVISAHEFDVLNAAGHVEAKLRSRTANDKDALEVYDDQGVKRVGILANSGEGAAFNLYGADGTNRMTVAAVDSDDTNAIELSRAGKELMNIYTTNNQGEIEFKFPDGSTKRFNGQ